MLALLCASTLSFVVNIGGTADIECTNWADINTNDVVSLTIKSGDFSTRSMLNGETNIFEKLEKITIMEDVKLDENMSICEKWFWAHEHLETVRIDAQVTEIDSWAFYNCTLLKSIIFSNCVE